LDAGHVDDGGPVTGDGGDSQRQLDRTDAVDVEASAQRDVGHAIFGDSGSDFCHAAIRHWRCDEDVTARTSQPPILKSKVFRSPAFTLTIADSATSCSSAPRS